MKLKGIKKAVHDFNEIANSGLYARAYLNKRTGEVWTQEYASENGYTVFEDKDIVAIVCGGGLYPTSTTMKILREAAEGELR